MDRPIGLRERKKAAVRRSLHEAALRLVIEQGLEHVTVEAIAEAATLSRRTFSNYFSSKEEALFYHDAVRSRLLLDLLHDRPLDESPRTALARAAEQLVAETDSHDPDWLAQHRLLLKHPALVAHRAAVYAATEREMAAEITRRLPETDTASDLHARIIAATFLATLRTAIQHWIATPGRTLREIVAEALDYTQP
jgi:AcrR family transcriptional regulator